MILYFWPKKTDEHKGSALGWQIQNPLQKKQTRSLNYPYQKKSNQFKQIINPTNDSRLDTFNTEHLLKMVLTGEDSELHERRQHTLNSQKHLLNRYSCDHHLWDLNSWNDEKNATFVLKSENTYSQWGTVELPLLSDLTGLRPLLLGGRYFRVAVSFGYLKTVCNSIAVSRKKDT